MKKSNKSVIWNPMKDVVFGASPLSPPPGINADNVPANLFAAAFAKNHVPINKDENLAGDSLETIERPIGERQSSPTVITP